VNPIGCPSITGAVPIERVYRLPSGFELSLWLDVGEDARLRYASQPGRKIA
jgi:hypothetical protein